MKNKTLHTASTGNGGSIVVVIATVMTTILAGAGFAADPGEVAIHIIDDVSGKELVEEHGIRPAGFEEIQALANVIFDRRTSGFIGYDVIDENGDDNTPLGFFIEPFNLPTPEVPTFRGLTVVEKRKRLAEFQAAVSRFKAENLEWRRRILEGAEEWVDRCVVKRTVLEARFLEEMRERGGDFPHSDVLGAIRKGNARLGAQGIRFLIVNSDLDHRPGASAETQDPRPLSTEELDPEIVLVLVNASGIPAESPLLQGIPNRIERAGSLLEAAEIVAEVHDGEGGSFESN